MKHPHVTPLPKHSWRALPYVSVSFADFNMCPFTVINHNCERNGFSVFLRALLPETGLGDVRPRPCARCSIHGVSSHLVFNTLSEETVDSEVVFRDGAAGVGPSTAWFREMSATWAGDLQMDQGTYGTRALCPDTTHTATSRLAVASFCQEETVDVRGAEKWTEYQKQASAVPAQPPPSGFSRNPSRELRRAHRRAGVPPGQRAGNGESGRTVSRSSLLSPFYFVLNVYSEDQSILTCTTITCFRDALLEEHSEEGCVALVTCVKQANTPAYVCTALSLLCFIAHVRSCELWALSAAVSPKYD